MSPVKAALLIYYGWRQLKMIIGREWGQLKGWFACESSFIRLIISSIVSLSPALTADLQDNIINASSWIFSISISLLSDSANWSNKSTTAVVTSRVDKIGGTARIRIVLPPKFSISNPIFSNKSICRSKVASCCCTASIVTGNRSPWEGTSSSLNCVLLQ